MSGFDSNPFADPFASSPFSDPAVTQVTNQTNRNQPGLDDYNPFAEPPRPTPVAHGNQIGDTLPQYPAQARVEPSQPAVMQAISEPPPAYSPNAAQTMTSEDLRRKQEELEKKAAELQAKEDALRQGTYDARANNWPPLPKSCCFGPCFYHDISVDIPLEFQKLVKTMYYLWLYYIIVLLLNVLGAMALAFTASGYLTTFGFSLLFFPLFVPLSFVCWFRPLYKAFRSDSSFNFMVFFFIFFCQFIVGVLFAVGFSNVGGCGFIVAISVMETNKAAGTLALIIAALHTIFAVASIYMLIKIHRLYRSTGASFAKAQQEFTSGVLRNEHVQSAAAGAVSGAARQSFNQQFGSTNRY